MHFWSVLVVAGLYFVGGNATPVSSTVATATPLVVPPSQMWDGNDGPWSSIFLRVGSPPQSVRVLVSTSSNQPLVVLPEACDCDDPAYSNDRGGIFQSNTSTTWVPRNASATYAVALDPTIGLIPEVRYGSDTFALGYLGSGLPVLSDQLVGQISTTDLYTGIFGLNPLATDFSSNSPEIASYMMNLKAENQIPSLSYGYNAGNGYRFKTVLASLTLGGYDASLFNANNLSFAFDSQSNSGLKVNIKSITQTSFSGNNTKNSTLSSGSFSAFIDTTTAYLWLPEEICTQFEAQFGLTYDNASGLYLVNDTLHKSLLAQNANITFTLGNSSSTETTDIVLPYAAFDLIASSPLVKFATRYFPLKRANTTSQITLGRTFFQEAYLIADYERSTFSISQMSWNPNAQAQITTILPVSSASSNSTTTSTSPAQNKKKAVPATTIVAATLCSAIFLTILVASIILIRQRQKKLAILVKTPPTPAPVTTFAPFINPLNISPPNCAHCRSVTPSPEPVSMNSTEISSSSMGEAGRRSLANTPIFSGLSVPTPAQAPGPVSPISPTERRQSIQNQQPISPSSPTGGPLIPPRFSSLDRVATSPTNYQFPNGIYELPAREEVPRTDMPVETVLREAMDNVLLSHAQESQVQTPSYSQPQVEEYTPYNPPSSSSSPTLPQATPHNARRQTLHSPIYSLFPTPSSTYSTPTPRTTPTPRARSTPKLRVQTSSPQARQERRERTSTWIHSPIYGSEDANLGGGGRYTFDSYIHPSLRPASLQIQTPTQNQNQTQTQPSIQNQAQPQGQSQNQSQERREDERGSGRNALAGQAGPAQQPARADTRDADTTTPRERDLIAEHAARIREHAERIREREALKGRRGQGGPSSPPPRGPLPALPTTREERAEEERGEGEERSPGSLDPREYSWLRLH